MKYLWGFAYSRSPRETKALAIQAAISGLVSAGLLGLVNRVATRASSNIAPGWGELLLYLLGFALYFWSARGSLVEANRVIERLITELRLSITNKIRQAELSTIEKLGRGDLYTRLNQTTQYLSLVFPMMISACQDLVLFVCCVLYIAYLSPMALVLLILFSGVAGWWARGAQADLMRAYGLIYSNQSELVDQMSHVVKGFKELKINRRKSDAVSAEFERISEQLRLGSHYVAGQQVALTLFSTSFVYGLLAAITFILPLYVEVDGATTFKLTAAFLFCIGPVMAAAALGPLLWRAETGLARLHELEEKLDQGATPRPENLSQLISEVDRFKTLTYHQVSYSYDEGFKVGPLTLELRRGEVLFLVGGNGSGKSTLLKMLCGLYSPEQGEILLDGQALGPAKKFALRERFSTVFTDYHLFDRFYGSEQGYQTEKVQEWLELMELSPQVKFIDGAFSTTRVSTGQQKRLALIAALAEDKPFYVFDEWTADQDQQFRHHFYHRILPDLKAQGKTVIAVTHDDRYWQTADRVIKLELGQLVEDR